MLLSEVVFNMDSSEPLHFVATMVKDSTCGQKRRSSVVNVTCLHLF